jgi:hypothetical protein
MTAQVDIWNLALGRLQIGQMIETPDDATTPARHCRRLFPQCRDEVLRDFPWGFANKAEALAAVADQVYPGWTYVYQYPQKCAAVRSVADENGMRYARAAFNWPDTWTTPQLLARFPFDLALKADGDSQVILSDVPSAWVFHTAIVENLNVWPADALSILAWKLAGEAGGPLQADARLVQAAVTAYEGLRIRAAAASRNESRDDREADASSIRARQ